MSGRKGEEVRAGNKVISWKVHEDSCGQLFIKLAISSGSNDKRGVRFMDGYTPNRSCTCFTAQLVYQFAEFGVD